MTRLRPQRKVVGGGVAGAFTTVLIFVSSLFGIDVDGYTGAALTTVVGVTAAYFTPVRQASSGRSRRTPIVKPPKEEPNG